MEKGEIVKKKWLFTDCFDTLLMRKCAPDYAKQKWAKHIEALLSYRISSMQIYNSRRSAERFLIANIKNGEFEAKELYRETINRLLLINEEEILRWGIDKLEKLFWDTELMVEKESLSLNARHIERLSNFSGSIAVVSDYYMDSSFLWQLFAHFGIADRIQKIYVSSEYRENKRCGNLYRIALEDLGVLPEDVEMYGDNIVSDVKQAKKHGISAHLVNDSLPTKTVDLKKETQSNIKNTLYSRIYKIESFSRFALTFYLFIERLYRRCIVEGIHNIYFLSREGELLKKLFDIYVQEMPQKVASHYLFVSRKAVIRSTFGNIDDEDFSELRKNFSSVSMRKLMEFIGLSEKDIDEVEKGNQLDIDFLVPNWWESDVFKSLLKCDTFRAAYQVVTDKNRNIFHDYLQQNGFYDDDKVAIVDVGWSGTIQDRLHRVAGKEQTLFGYYCGLISNADFSRTNRKDGILFSDCYGYSKDFDVWKYDYTFFERMLTASHASTDGYKNIDGKIAPVFKEFSTETESYHMILPTQNLLVASFEKICTIINKTAFSAEDFYDYILENHIRVILSMGIKKAKFQQKLYANQADNLVCGSITKQKNVNVFGIKQILRKGVHRLSIFRNTEIIIKIFAQNHLYIFIPFFAGLKKRAFIGKIKRNK